MRAFTILIALFYSSSNFPQNDFTPELVGGPCEGCEAVFEFGDRVLSPVDTLPDYNDDGPKLKLTGTIYQIDGVTPAKDIILYIYHTDQKGIYPKKGDETGWAKRHGYLRGWIKTSDDGKYSFYTLRPASYPSRSAPEHIHATILEPNGKYYWIEDYFFEDDPLLSDNHFDKSSKRGGEQFIISLSEEGELILGKRDIILGKNIPDYDR
jgi:protocatechuate 3,4-dioxygenase beta subunit